MDRADPHAERQVLGAALLRPELVAVAEAIVRPEDFADPVHAAVWEAVLAVSPAVDVTTVAAALRRAKRSNLVGLDYLGRLTDGCPTGAHLEEHARIVADHARARRAAAVLRAALAALEDPATSAADAAARAETGLAEVARSRGAGGTVDVQDSAFGAIQAWEELLAGRAVAALPTGLTDLDDLLGGGARPGQLVVLGARPAMGKSALGAQLALHAAAATRTPALYVSLEMGHAELTARLLAARAGVDAHRARRGQFRHGEVARLQEAAASLDRAPLVYLDDAGDEVSLAEVRAAALRLKATRGLCLVVVDYLQLLRPVTPRDSREREVAEMTRGLKRLARALAVPVLLLSQLNRGAEARSAKDHRPRMADLRESGAVEQDADVIALLYRDEVYNPKTEHRGIAELIVAKQRGGPTGTVRLRWDAARTAFADDRDAPARSYTAPDAWSGADDTFTSRGGDAQ